MSKPLCDEASIFENHHATKPPKVKCPICLNFKMSKSQHKEIPSMFSHSLFWKPNIKNMQIGFVDCRMLDLVFNPFDTVSTFLYLTFHFTVMSNGRVKR